MGPRCALALCPDLAAPRGLRHQPRDAACSRYAMWSMRLAVAVIEQSPALAALLEDKWDEILELLESGGLALFVPEHDKEYKCATRYCQ